MAGGLTVLPPRKHWAESLNEGISPYLQMMFQAQMKKQAEEDAYNRAMQALTPSTQDIQQQATQKYGQPFYSSPTLPPEIAKLRLAQKSQLASQGYGQPQGTGMTMQPPIPEKLRKAMGMFSNLPSGVGATAEIAPGISLKSKEPSLMEQMIAMQGLGEKGVSGKGKSGGIKLPPKTIDEAKQTLIDSGENPSDYSFKPILNTGKGGVKIQSGFEPVFEPDLQKTRISNEKQGELIRGTAQDTLATISKIKEQINQFGFTGPIPKIPGTKEYIWQANVNKLLSGKIVELITEMKLASKTGATGFGQLSDREGQILREASTALKKGLPPEEALSLLNTMEERLRKVVEGGSNGQTNQLQQTDPLGLR